IVMMLLLIGLGFFKSFTGAAAVASVAVLPHLLTAPVGFAFTFLILRAFAEGCVAMIGTEAISNGVGVFKRPSSFNAATTFGWMATILAVFFLGTSVLACHFGVMPFVIETVLSQLGRRVFGGGPMYYVLQYVTFAILVLAT